MLKYRLVFGPLMVAAAFAIPYLDQRLENVSIEGTAWATLFGGRSHLPPGLVLAATVWILVAFGARELNGLFRAKSVAADTLLLALCAVFGSAMLYVLPDRPGGHGALVWAASGVALLLVLAMIRAAWHRQPAGATASVGAAMFTLVYLGVLPGFYLAMRHTASAWVVMALILVVKCCDIGAFTAGKLLGRHRLAPWLSPAKTWEGLAGGMAASAAAAAGLTLLADRAGGAVAIGWSVPAALGAGAVLGLVGQLGDVAASLLKRDAGVKDWSGAVPGFGGLLDVLDSPILAAPVAYWLLVVGSAHPVPGPPT